MIPYEVLVTAVSERSDLFVETMESMLANLDTPPQRLIVHEDVRAGSTPGAIGSWLKKCSIESSHRVNPTAGGLGPAMLWCFQQARTPIVFYTQEDWLYVRSLPVARAIQLMQDHDIHHIRFNKRKTMRAKHADTDHPWYKIEKEFSGQKLCVSDHWYTQASLWRVREVLRELEDSQHCPQANAFVAEFNRRMNVRCGDGRAWNDQEMRHERLRTYIWGPVAEPPFIKHLGSIRTTGPIVHLPGA